MKPRGFTLLELVVVIVLTGILTGIAVRGVDYSFREARFQSTVREMETLGQAMVGDARLVSAGARTDFGFVGDMGRFPASLGELVSGAAPAWDGPYLNLGFTEDGEGFTRDGWGQPYVWPVQGDKARLMSTAGGDTVTYRIAADTSDVLANTISGTVMDSRGSPPALADLANATVTLTRPVNGTLVTSEIQPSPGGTFQFTGVPIGNHRMSARHAAMTDSVALYVTVTPASSPLVNFRFPSPFPGGGGGGGGGEGNFLFSAGSADAFGTNNRCVKFSVVNTSAGDASFNSLSASFTTSPASWYEEVRVGGTIVWDENNPRTAPGGTITFTTRTLASGNSIEIQLRDFRGAVSGAASDVSVYSTLFTVTLSDGSVVVFTAE